MQEDDTVATSVIKEDEHSDDQKEKDDDGEEKKANGLGGSDNELEESKIDKPKVNGQEDDEDRIIMNNAVRRMQVHEMKLISPQDIDARKARLMGVQNYRSTSVPFTEGGVLVRSTVEGTCILCNEKAQISVCKTCTCGLCLDCTESSFDLCTHCREYVCECDECNILCKCMKAFCSQCGNRCAECNFRDDTEIRRASKPVVVKPKPAKKKKRKKNDEDEEYVASENSTESESENETPANGENNSDQKKDEKTQKTEQKQNGKKKPKKNSRGLTINGNECPRAPSTYIPLKAWEGPFPFPQRYNLPLWPDHDLPAPRYTDPRFRTMNQFAENENPKNLLDDIPLHEYKGPPVNPFEKVGRSMVIDCNIDYRWNSHLDTRSPQLPVNEKAQNFIDAIGRRMDEIEKDPKAGKLLPIFMRSHPLIQNGFNHNLCMVVRNEYAKGFPCDKFICVEYVVLVNRGTGSDVTSGGVHIIGQVLVKVLPRMKGDKERLMYEVTFVNHGTRTTTEALFLMGGTTKRDTIDPRFAQAGRFGVGVLNAGAFVVRSCVADMDELHPKLSSYDHMDRPGIRFFLPSDTEVKKEKTIGKAFFARGPRDHLVVTQTWLKPGRKVASDKKVNADGKEEDEEGQEEDEAKKVEKKSPRKSPTKKERKKLGHPKKYLEKSACESAVTVQVRLVKPFDLTHMLPFAGEYIGINGYDESTVLIGTVLLEARMQKRVYIHGHLNQMRMDSEFGYDFRHPEKELVILQSDRGSAEIPMDSYSYLLCRAMDNIAEVKTVRIMDRDFENISCGMILAMMLVQVFDKKGQLDSKSGRSAGTIMETDLHYDKVATDMYGLGDREIKRMPPSFMRLIESAGMEGPTLTRAIQQQSKDLPSEDDYPVQRPEEVSVEQHEQIVQLWAKLQPCIITYMHQRVGKEASTVLKLCREGGRETALLRNCTMYINCWLLEREHHRTLTANPVKDDTDIFKRVMTKVS